MAEEWQYRTPNRVLAGSSGFQDRAQDLLGYSSKFYVVDLSGIEPNSVINAVTIAFIQPESP